MGIQFKMQNDGGSYKGRIDLVDKDSILDVRAEYTAAFKVEGELAKNSTEDFFQRYLIECAKAVANKWLDHEKSVAKTFRKKIADIEKVLRKQASKTPFAQLEKAVKAQEQKLKDQLAAELQKELDSCISSSHKTALKNMDKAAKAVLKSRKALFMTALKIAGGLVFTVALTAGAVAVTAATGGVGGVAIAGAVAACLAAAAGAAVAAIKLSNEFIGNFKSYNKSLGQLDAQIIETIKFARACEKKSDALQIRKAEIEDQIKKMKREDPKAAFVKNKKILAAEKELASVSASMDRMLEYNRKDVEESLVEARRLVRNLQGEPFEERGVKLASVLKVFAKTAGAASTGLSTADTGIGMMK